MPLIGDRQPFLPPQQPWTLPSSPVMDLSGLTVWENCAPWVGLQKHLPEPAVLLQFLFALGRDLGNGLFLPHSSILARFWAGGVILCPDQLAASPSGFGAGFAGHVVPAPVGAVFGSGNFKLMAAFHLS